MKKKSKSGSLYLDDPQAAVEAEKYENPVPSREYILQCLEEHGKLLNREQLAEIFQLNEDPDLLEGLRRRLRAMERDGQIIYTRRGFAPVSKLDLVRGRVIGHPDGFGFLVPDEGGDDLFLSAKQMSRVMHGDRVVAHIVGYNRRGKAEGAIVEVLEHANKQLVGRFFSESGACFLVADNKRISQDIIIPCDQTSGASNGQFVVAEITQQPSKKRQIIGRVKEILGDHMAPGMEIDVAIRSYGLPSDWPEAVSQDTAGLSPEVAEKDKQERLDLRDMPLVTIDGEDARDFDDAVFCEPTRGGWRLYVAIADVSHYVAPDTALDIEAEDRGNSVYFPERVVPMLPEILSNGLCSLNPHVDRLCMVCEMNIDQSGNITRSRFHEAVMCSHARFTYNKVAAILVDNDQALRSEHAELVPHLENLYDLYKVLRQQRTERGAIDFETPETRIVFSADRKIEKIVPVVRNDAHMLIEECMIAANVCSARFLLKHKISGLFRVHENPNSEKVAELREFLGELGLQLKGGEVPDALHYAELLEQAKGRVDFHLIQTVLLRSLKQAQYIPDNDGHFGLALDAYSHFTSPIRRYPDLLTHRAIRHMLRHKKVGSFPYNHEAMLQMGEHCSMTDRRADEATRDVVSWLKCEFMQDKVGDEFEGVISSVTSFGIFVELNDIYVEGLVHVTELDNDYYHFDASGHRLVGERTAQVFRLGDRVRIQVVRVDLDERKMDFSLLEHTSLNTGKSKRTSSADGSGAKKKRKGNSSKKKSTTKKSTAKQKKTGGKKVAKKRTSGKKSQSKKSTANSKKKPVAKKKAVTKKKKTTAKKASSKKTESKPKAKKKSIVKRAISSIKKKIKRKKKS